MGAEDFRDDVERAIESAVASNTSPDEIEAVLEEMEDRVDAIRAFRGEA